MAEIIALRRKHQTGRVWVDETHQANHSQRDSAWTGSLAVGRLEFVEGVKEALGIKAHTTVPLTMNHR